MASAWGYTTITGPHTWGDNFPAASGQQQSPIDINVSDIVQDPELAPLTINYNSTHSQKLENTGHGFKVSMKPGSKSEISGGPMANKYRLEQFHFHWGTNDLNGSEHTVNGESFASEVHLVHWNAEKYDSFASAVSQPDGLCVLGAFLKVGKAHSEIQKLIDKFSDVEFKGDSVPLSGIDCTALLPGDKAFWTYPGSLTTPPCNECVIWVVFKEPLEISTEQLSEFRTLRCHCIDEDAPNDEYGGKILVNYRPPLGVGSRVVRHTS